MKAHVFLSNILRNVLPEVSTMSILLEFRTILEIINLLEL